jgi:hypothetical protein
LQLVVLLVYAARGLGLPTWSRAYTLLVSWCDWPHWQWLGQEVYLLSQSLALATKTSIFNFFYKLIYVWTWIGTEQSGLARIHASEFDPPQNRFSLGVTPWLESNCQPRTSVLNLCQQLVLCQRSVKPTAWCFNSRFYCLVLLIVESPSWRAAPAVHTWAHTLSLIYFSFYETLSLLYRSTFYF